jgi:hypothetical protein
MRLGLALGAAVIAITAAVAYADSEGGRRFAFHRGEHVSADTNGDGWLTRDEAAAQADRLFADLDRDNNSRLNDRDGELLEQEVEAEVERAMEGFELDMEQMELELEGLDEEIEREVAASLQHLNDTNCETTTESSDGEVRTTTVCRDLEGANDDGERRTDRRVHVVRHRNGDRFVHPVPPIPPVPPVPHVMPVPPVPPMPPIPHIHGPVFWGGGDNDESDLNGDGWLSREEFRAQQLRYFDAQDANNDGRVRYDEPPEPPTPPEPPRHERHRDRDRDRN